MDEKKSTSMFRFVPEPEHGPDDVMRELGELITSLAREYGFGAHIALLSPDGTHYIATAPGWTPLQNSGTGCELSYQVDAASAAARAEGLKLAERYARDLQQMSNQLSDYADRVHRAIGAGRREIEALGEETADSPPAS